MKKILTIIAAILFLAFGFSLRKTSKELDNQEIKDAVNEYKICLDKIEKMKITLEKNKSLSDEELVKLKELEERGEKPSRTIQVGFDPETGTPKYEEQLLDTKPLPS